MEHALSTFIKEQMYSIYFTFQVLPPSPHGQGIKTEVVSHNFNEVNDALKYAYLLFVQNKTDRVETPEIESDTMKFAVTVLARPVTRN